MTSPVENLFTSSAGYRIPATPCQRAICRVIDGEPLADLWQDEDVRRMLGGVRPSAGRPDQVVLAKSPRTGGSIIGACMAITRAVTCDLSSIGDRENLPSVAVVSVRKRNARAIVGHVGKLMQTPAWGPLLVGKVTADRVCVKHLGTGAPIAIEVIAGSTAASNLESFWFAAVIFDETFKLDSERNEAAVNLEDARRAVRGRILPGGQIFYLGSTWAPEGPAYELLETYFRAPSRECVAMRASGPMLHPRLWSPDRISQLAASKSQEDRDLAVLAMGEFLTSVNALLAPEVIAQVMRDGNLAPQVGVAYAASIDPAARRNAFTLGVAHRQGGKLVVDVARSWEPEASKPLDLDAIAAEVARVVTPYGVTRVWSDQWEINALAVVFRRHGLELLELTPGLRGSRQQAAYQGVVDLVQNCACSLPDSPEMRRDLGAVGRRVTQTGPAIYLRKTPDGRHADYAAMLALLGELTPAEFSASLTERFPHGFLEGRVDVVHEDPWRDFGVMRPRRIYAD